MNSQRRPATISELAEQARSVNWDDNGTLKYFLRIAEKERKAGAQHFEHKDLESAFVAFARAASLILERIPNHRDYKAILSETQRSNLALNGQEILDNLGHLKPILLSRYEKWEKLHPNGQDTVGELASAMNRVDFNTEQDRRAKEELELWRRQREDSQRRLEQERLVSAHRHDAAMSAARQAAVAGALPASIPQFRPSTGPRIPDDSPYERPRITPTTAAITMPTPTVPTAAPMVSNSRPPSYLERPLSMPLESPSKYEGDSTDTESVTQSHTDWHRHKQLDATPSRQPIRSPSYPIPVTTTSPPPPEVSHIRYPQLMSPHQRTQGYFPSANSMFIQGPRPGPSLASLAFEDRSLSGPQNLYSSSMLPTPSTSVPPPAQLIPNPPPLDSHYSSKIPPPVPTSQNAEANGSSSFGLKIVNLPRDSLPRFLAIANANTLLNRETCGLLLGKHKGTKYVVTTLLIPRQHSTSDTCTMDEEELVLQFTEERSLITLGWIHTHPSQSCFMSSVDLHTHSGFQRMLPESFAVVCAPKSNPKYGIFRLTDPPGLQTILSCNATAAFHPHPDLPIYTDADKGHVQMKDISLEIVDLR